MCLDAESNMATVILTNSGNGTEDHNSQCYSGSLEEDYIFRLIVDSGMLQTKRWPQPG